MPLDSAIVGQQIEAITHSVDARWIMAYAAALDDYNPLYFHTHEHTVSAHPVFPVCVEWPVILNTRALAGSQTLTVAEAARGVHATHDLHILRPIRADDVLSTHATMVEVKAIKPGAAYTMRLDTHDQQGALVARTYQLGIYRGVEVTGGDRREGDIPSAPERLDLSSVATSAVQQIPIRQGLAHTYTECARIWNPIHTDTKIALDAGLPDIILHGTATLALAITAVVNRYADGNPGRVKRLGGRFAAMVEMPSNITLRSAERQGTVTFAVDNAAGDAAISGGYVVLGDNGG